MEFIRMHVTSVKRLGFKLIAVDLGTKCLKKRFNLGL